MSGEMVLRMTMKSAKAAFIDRGAIAERINKRNRRALGRFGGFVRTWSRRSMRPARKQKIGEFDKELKALVRRERDEKGRYQSFADDIQPWPIQGSRPGEPPRYRSRILRDLIFFVVSPTFDSVIIGPLVGQSGGSTPELLEYGGTGSAYTGTWKRFYDKGKRKIRLSDGRRKGVRFPARPFMRPAYDEALDTLVPDLWRE